MLLGRSRSKDRKVTPPGPSFMNSKQMGQPIHGFLDVSFRQDQSPVTMGPLLPAITPLLSEKHLESSYLHSETADYLGDLRTNRPARPTGARPLPASSFATRKAAFANGGETTQSTTDLRTRNNRHSIATLPAASAVHEAPRSSSAQGHCRTDSGLSIRGNSETMGRPLVQAPTSSKLVPRALSPAPVAIPEEAPISPNSSLSPTSITSQTQYIPYRESGQRWMEKQEAHSLRRALEDMDIKEDERVHKDAQDEASELVWQHQNPDAAAKEKELGKVMDYREHLRKGSHARSQSIAKEQSDIVEGRTRSVSATRNRVRFEDTDGSSGSYRSAPASGTSSRTSSNGSVKVPSTFNAPTPNISQPEEDRGRRPAESRSLPSRRKGYADLAKSAIAPRTNSLRKRSTSSSRRKISGSLFRNPNDQIYEEPEETIPSPAAPTTKDKKPSEDEKKVLQAAPSQARRNPFARVKLQERLGRTNSAPEMGKTNKYDRFEIHRNPPTQSRNPAYTSNSLPATPPKAPLINENGEDHSEAVKMKDGKEIRSEELCAATMKKLKDRSPKLPTPTYVSDSPGRPIVSFKDDWKPSVKEIELEQEMSSTPPATPAPPPGRVAAMRGIKAASAPVVPSIRIREDAPSELNRTPPAIPILNLPDNPPALRPNSNGPSIPIISLPDDRPTQTTNAVRPIPTINLPDDDPRIPQITVDDATSVPSISVSPSVPSISISSSSIPTPNNPSRASAPSTRPLPSPSQAKSHGGFRPAPRHAFSAPATANAIPHISPSIRRTTALCSACALPIAGRTVSAGGSRFHPECFRCHYCAEALECVAFYPEPSAKRDERLARIRARRNGEDIPLPEGWMPGRGEDVEDVARRLEAEDGDEGMRFYCHLDYHEFFSPRCKSCKTPIEGEVIVACGAEWHAGHFFCAQCGDPFEASTPFVEKDGYAWCVGCHTNRYSTKCKKCRKPVTDTVVKALGAEWHTHCFCCMECNGQFEDGRYFLRGDSTDPVCVRCEERRLKA